MTRITVEPLAIPPRFALDSAGYGSSVIGLPDRGSALFAAHAGSAFRCVRVDVDGGFTLIPKVRGLLRDAEPEGDTHLWLLATHGLHLVDLATDRVVETIRAGLPAYPVRLSRLDADHLVLSVVASGTATIVSTSEGRVVQRIRMPTVDLVLHPDEGPILCSFERGVARRIDATWHRVGADRSIPTAIAPVQVGSTIAAVLTDLVRVTPGSEVTGPRSRGVVALFDADLGVIRERPISGLERIDGQTPDGTLLGATLDAIVLVDPASLEEVGRAGKVGWMPVVGPMAPRTALSLALRGRTADVPSLSILRW